VLLGQSLGTAVTSAAALYCANTMSRALPMDLVHTYPVSKKHEGFAAIILVAPFTDLPSLLKTYKIAGLLPVLRPMQGYPRIANFLASKIVDQWPTRSRLLALIHDSQYSKIALHVHILHARNDWDISFRESEALYEGLQSAMLSEEGASAVEERRSIHGGERVRRGAFAYRKVEDARGERGVEMEVVRYGGHNEVVGFAQVSLAVRRALERKSLKPGLDVE
jgi:pimeloyl-ACP methyl ester carboxylesterase